MKNTKTQLFQASNKMKKLKNLTGVDYTSRHRCDNCQDKEADCWVANELTHGGNYNLCRDCYPRRWVILQKIRDAKEARQNELAKALKEI